MGTEDGHDFVMPIPLGVDTAGHAYVLDRQLRHVRRFDSRGQFDSLVVRPGEGPGEMRTTPLTFGLQDGTIWFSEIVRGRLQFVPTDGAPPFSEDTGWQTPDPRDRIAEVRPGRSRDAFRVRVRRTLHSPGVLRPPVRYLHVLATPDAADTIYEHQTSGSFIHLDEGGTIMRYPGPPDHSMVLDDPARERLVRIDRPIELDSSHAEIVLQEIGYSGLPGRRVEVRLRPVELASSQRDYIESELLRMASWDGERTLSREVRDVLGHLVDEIPSRLPAFKDAAISADGSVWLSLHGGEGDDLDRWLVLDSSFSPISTVDLPSNIVDIGAPDERGWLSLAEGPLRVRYVIRIVVDSQVDGSPDPESRSTGEA